MPESTDTATNASPLPIDKHCGRSATQLGHEGFDISLHKYARKQLLSGFVTLSLTSFPINGCSAELSHGKSAVNRKNQLIALFIRALFPCRLGSNRSISLFCYARKLWATIEFLKFENYSVSASAAVERPENFWRQVGLSIWEMAQHFLQ